MVKKSGDPKKEIRLVKRIKTSTTPSKVPPSPQDMAERTRSSTDKRSESETSRNNTGGDAIVNEKVYSIQIGNRLFKLSGASLLSDSPSYFTLYFSNKHNEGKVLFIDRSPAVFEKVYLHLQGYYVDIRDEYEFAYLFADANYYDLPGLKDIIYKSDIFTRIGNKSFRISKELITSPGNVPNYFSVSFNALYGESLDQGLLRKFLRPPQLKPPTLSTHSLDLFEELLGLLQGKPLQIRSEDHRRSLLKECRYYKFLALEQQVINHKILVNPFTGQEEIILNIEDIKKKGCSTVKPLDDHHETILTYSRPYADKGISRTLIIHFLSSDLSLFVNRRNGGTTLEVHGETGKKLNKLLTSINATTLYDTENYILSTIVDMTEAHCNINNRDMVSDWIANLTAPDLPEESLVFKLLKADFKIVFRGTTPWFKGTLLQAVSDKASFYKQIESI